MKKHILFGIIMSCILCACSIGARKYRPGFYIHHKTQVHTASPVHESNSYDSVMAFAETKKAIEINAEQRRDLKQNLPAKNDAAMASHSYLIQEKKGFSHLQLSQQKIAVNHMKQQKVSKQPVRLPAVEQTPSADLSSPFARILYFLLVLIFPPLIIIVMIGPANEIKKWQITLWWILTLIIWPVGIALLIFFPVLLGSLLLRLLLWNIIYLILFALIYFKQLFGAY